MLTHVLERQMLSNRRTLGPEMLVSGVPGGLRCGELIADGDTHKLLISSGLSDTTRTDE